MSSLVGVKFTRHYHSYNRGENAHFPPHVANKMVELGVAERFVDAVEQGAKGAAEEPEAQAPASKPEAKVRTRNRTQKPEVVQK